MPFLETTKPVARSRSVEINEGRRSSDLKMETTQVKIRFNRKQARRKTLIFVSLLNIWKYSDCDVVISILTLVDTALIAVLLLIIVSSGYESFVSRININDHEDRPAWMGKVGFADLKLKLIGA